MDTDKLTENSSTLAPREMIEDSIRQVFARLIIKKNLTRSLTSKNIAAEKDDFETHEQGIVYFSTIDGCEFGSAYALSLLKSRYPDKFQNFVLIKNSAQNGKFGKPWLSHVYAITQSKSENLWYAFSPANFTLDDTINDQFKPLSDKDPVELAQKMTEQSGGYWEPIADFIKNGQFPHIIERPTSLGETKIYFPEFVIGDQKVIRTHDYELLRQKSGIMEAPYFE